NIGSESVTLGQALLSGGGGQYAVTGLAAGQVVAPGARVPFSVRFTPGDLGDSSGLLRIPNSGSASALSLHLSGTGLAPTGHAVVSAVDNDFGGVDLGSPAVRRDGAVTITN